MEKEDDGDERDDDALLRERPPQRLDRAVDQVRTVIDRYNLHIFWQGRRHFGQTRLHIVNDIKRVLAKTLQDDATADLAFAIDFGNAPAFVRPKFDPGNVLQQNRRPL